MLLSARTRARLTSLGALTAVAVGTTTALPALTAAAAAETGVRYVSPAGADTNPGTFLAPFRTVRKGMTSLAAGDTLVLRGGTYTERIQSPAIVPGTPSAHTKVVAYPGERPVVQGLLWLKDASYWDINGVNVTWDAATGRPSEHMVKLAGGTGWSFTGAEVWGARSYAGILVAGAASGWRIADNYVHDTHATNNTNQDHLIYANSGAGGGVIERNVLVRSANGRAVKVGPPSATSGTVANIVIRYNTMVDNKGPSSVQLAWGTSGVQVYRNIMVAPQTGRSAVTAFQLTGTGNVVRDNLGWETPRLADAGILGLADGGGNLITNPAFVDRAGSDFRTTAAAAAAYGRFADIAPVSAGTGLTDATGSIAVLAPAPTPSTAPAPAPVASNAATPAPTTTSAPVAPRRLSTCTATTRRFVGPLSRAARGCLTTVRR